MKALITIGATLIILFVFLILVTKKQLRDIRKRVKSSNISHVDSMKEEDKSYYREILKGYSPAVLSYIDNFEINPDGSNRDEIKKLNAELDAIMLKVKRLKSEENAEN